MGQENKTDQKGLWKGNHSIVEGAIAGGLDAYFGYPITPQNEVTEYMSVRMRQEDRVFIQAESELSAINMVFGAALTGKRAMTSSSSPGVSLMQEGISYLAGCDLPAVIVNVQRGGPGLGNISGAQGDYFQSVKGGGHGDYRTLVLTPSTVPELYEMTKRSFDLAFEYRSPVIILTDGVLGQMMEPAEVDTIHEARPDDPGDTGWNLTGCRNREPRLIRSLYMGEGELERHNFRLQEKYKEMKKETDWDEENTEDADVILIGYGTSARINLDAYRKARDEGISLGYVKLKTVYPFPEERIRTLSEKSRLLVVEMSNGQLVEDVKLSSVNPAKVEFYGRPAGGIPAVDEILKKVKDIRG